MFRVGVAGCACDTVVGCRVTGAAGWAVDLRQSSSGGIGIQVEDSLAVAQSTFNICTVCARHTVAGRALLAASAKIQTQHPVSETESGVAARIYYAWGSMHVCTGASVCTVSLVQRYR
jgi:hypothetical protein